MIVTTTMGVMSWKSSRNTLMITWLLPFYVVKKDPRPEDMLFVLNSIYESYLVNKNQIIYLAFVDFSEYFDMINRKVLFYKLLKYRITEHVHHVIKVCMTTPGIHQASGAHCKTGLFYEINIVKYVSERSFINSISWLDDLLLLSTSKRGLQNCLNDLKSYCYKWGLQVTSSKLNRLTGQTNSSFITLI